MAAKSKQSAKAAEPTAAPKAAEDTSYQKRVIDEHADLGERMGKLQAFIAGDKFRDVNHLEQGRLKDQLDAMRTYSRILGERIGAFGK